MPRRHREGEKRLKIRKDIIVHITNSIPIGPHHCPCILAITKM